MTIQGGLVGFLIGLFVGANVAVLVIAIVTVGRERRIYMNFGMPPDVASAFFADLYAYYRESSELKREDIAARQRDALAEHMPRQRDLRTDDIKELFTRLKGLTE